MVKRTGGEFSYFVNKRITDTSYLCFGELFEKEYPLKEVNYELKYTEKNIEKVIDINYATLPLEIKRTIDFTTIPVIEIRVNDEEHKNRILYKIRQNLNSAGIELKNQELRNSVYQCDFYDMLHEINNVNEKWRQIYGEKHKYSRDVELLLRFAAVEYNFKLENGSIEVYNYENSYTKFLNDFSDVVIKFDATMINNYEINIEKFINKIERTGKIPNLLLESLYLASIYIEGEYLIGDEICNQILNDMQYNTLSSSSSKSKVKERFNYVYKELSKYVTRSKMVN